MKKILFYLVVSSFFIGFMFAQGGGGNASDKKGSTKTAIKPGIVKIVLKPKITGILTIPLGPLKADVRVYLKGFGFGIKKGEILMIGNFPPYRKVVLTNVTWANNKQINGFVPKKLAGQSAQTVKIVVVTSDKRRSDPYKIKFIGLDMDTP